MTSHTLEIPEANQLKPKSIGVPLRGEIPELEFPRKLEECTVCLWYGSEFRGRYSTADTQMWLLAPNVIKIDSGTWLSVVYNVTIVVQYHNYPKKE